MIGAVEIERDFAIFVNGASFSCLVGLGVVHQNAHVVRTYPTLSRAQGVDGNACVRARGKGGAASRALQARGAICGVGEGGTLL